MLTICPGRYGHAVAGGGMWVGTRPKWDPNKSILAKGSIGQNPSKMGVKIDTK